MRPVISVIVPVYNVEKYVSKCLDSILNQTFNDIEIIVVDDGSTDGSGVICDKYAQRDKRIKVFHKENGGLSSARNYGIDRAKSDYIGFVDSDDYIDFDMYEVLLDLILKNDADVSMCRLSDVYPTTKITKDSDTDRFIVNNEEAIKIVLEGRINTVSAINKLYKKTLFNKVRYPVGKIAEDAFVIVKLLQQCRRVAITTEKKYYYIHRFDSITTSKFSPKDCDIIEAYKQNYDIIINSFPKLKNVAKTRICWANFFVLDKMMNSDARQYVAIRNDIVSYLKRNFLFIVKNNNFNLRRKIAICLLMIHVDLYKLLSILNQKKKYG